jgi:imidazolonepropionase-like amidohydrolase
MTPPRILPGALACVLAAGGLLAAAPPAGASDLLIRDVTLIDGTGAPPVAGVDVLVSDGRIASITVDSPAPRGAYVVDGRGRFLAPGLIDTHVHVQGGRMPAKQGSGTYVDRPLALRTLQGYLYSGVTAIYDSGNNADFIFDLRAAERAGTIVSPRIFATGANITVPGGYADNAFSIKVADLAADRASLLAHFERRPDLQKILHDSLGSFGTPLAPVLSDQALAGVIRLANERGIPTTVHAVTELASRAVLEAGIDAFAHPVRAAASTDFVRRLAVKRVPVSTTLAVLAHIARVVEDPGFLDAPLFRATVEPEQLAHEQGPARLRYVENGMSPHFRLVVPHVAATVKKMHDAGVVLALGTDRTWGASVHMELELLHAAGIPLQDLVRIATLNGAYYLHREHEIGSIERGKLADLLLLREDPTRSVAAWQAIDAVYKGGKRVDLGSLDLPVNRGASGR